MEVALEGEITSELAHLAVDKIYAHYGKIGMEKRITLLRKYLDVAPNDGERFWAHEHIVYSLTCLDRNAEAIDEHKKLYRWTCQQMSDKHVLEVVSNLNSAGCWKDEGRIDEWMQMFI